MSGRGQTGGADVRHIQWAFALDTAPSLPLVGEEHPLRRERVKWLLSAGLVTILLVAAAFGGYYLWSHRPVPAETAHGPVRIVHYTDLGVPPSIARPAVPQLNVAQAVAKVKVEASVNVFPHVS